MIWVLPVARRARRLPVAVLRRPRPRAVHGVPVIRQTLLALAVVAALGYALNDSGVAIPALMAIVFECTLVYVVLARPPRPRVRGVADRAD